MVTNNINKLAEELEKQELEATNGIATPQIYAQLLAIYLYQNDLCNAKYLWKRIPASIKSSNPELTQIWTVGQHMWQRDFPSLYKILNTTTWSEHVNDIIKAVQETVAAMTGLTPDQTASACIDKGWTIDADKIVHPSPLAGTSSGNTSSEDQLYKLTEFVSFLEN